LHDRGDWRPADPRWGILGRGVCGVFFDSIDEMNSVDDEYAGGTRLEASADGWRVLK
jgi:hypothetical protein